MSKTVCDPANLATLATNAVVASGGNLSAYARKVFMFPRNACAWSGLGDVGGSATQAWINGRYDTQVVAHEMGHNFGLRHARALNCDVAVLGKSCTTLEYGDVADDMGNIAPAQFCPFAKAVKIPRGLDSSGRKRWYYLEYRQPIGADRHCQRPSPPSEYRVVWQLPPHPSPPQKLSAKPSLISIRIGAGLARPGSRFESRMRAATPTRLPSRSTRST